MSEPLAWLVEHVDPELGGRFFQEDAAAVDRLLATGDFKATALVAAPPEGHESPELEECRDRLHAMIAEGDADAGLIRKAFGIAPDGRSLTAQLRSIAPPEDGRPTRGELLQALRWNLSIPEGYAHALTCPDRTHPGAGCSCGFALLSRIPKETEGTVPVEFRAFGDGGELLASESVVSRADAPAMNVPVSEEG